MVISAERSINLTKSGTEYTLYFDFDYGHLMPNIPVAPVELSRYVSLAGFIARTCFKPKSL